MYARMYGILVDSNVCDKVSTVVRKLPTGGGGCARHTPFHDRYSPITHTHNPIIPTRRIQGCISSILWKYGIVL